MNISPPYYSRSECAVSLALSVGFAWATRIVHHIKSEPVQTVCFGLLLKTVSLLFFNRFSRQDIWARQLQSHLVGCLVTGPIYGLLLSNYSVEPMTIPTGVSLVLLSLAAAFFFPPQTVKITDHKGESFEAKCISGIPLSGIRKIKLGEALVPCTVTFRTFTQNEIVTYTESPDKNFKQKFYQKESSRRMTTIFKQKDGTTKKQQEETDLSKGITHSLFSTAYSDGREIFDTEILEDERGRFTGTLIYQEVPKDLKDVLSKKMYWTGTLTKPDRTVVHYKEGKIEA